MYCLVLIFLLAVNLTQLLADFDLNGQTGFSNRKTITENRKQKLIHKRQTNDGLSQILLINGKDWDIENDALIFEDGDLNFVKTSAIPRQVSFDDNFSTSNFEENVPAEIFPDENTRGNNCEERCPSTQEYNPVCGDDNITYPNIGKLQCAIRCGKRVSLQFRGGCLSKARGK